MTKTSSHLFDGEMLEKVVSHPLSHDEGIWNDTPYASDNSRDPIQTDIEGNQFDDTSNHNHNIDPELLTKAEDHAKKEQECEEKHQILITKPETNDPVGVEMEDEVEWVAPDGGYAWWVLFASIIVNILIPGTVKSFGILFIEFIEVFKASPAEAAWIPAISFFLYSSTGPFASALAIRFSDRLVTIVGGLLAAAGLCLSYFATSVLFLCFTYGVIGGLGSGLAYPIGVFIVARYFDRRRGLANGLCTSGSALGSVLMPQLLQFLLSNYGYRRAIVICGCLLLNVCLAAIFYDPVEKHLRKAIVPNIHMEDVEQAPASVPSEPIPIPARGRPLFQIGHDTPPGEMSWSPQSNGGPSPIAIKLSKEDSHHRQKPQPSICSTPDPSSLHSTTHSKLNLTAIPEVEDDADVDWNFFKGLPPGKQKLIKLSTHAPTPPPSLTQLHGGHPHLSQTLSQGEEKGLCRTMSMISNVSTSSFRYVSTIHHGSTLTAIQYDEDVNRNPTTDAQSPPLTYPVRVKRRPKEKNRKLFDFSLLSSPFFIIFLLSCATTAVSYTNFIILLPAFAQEKGFHKTEASYLLSLVAALDFVGRIGGAAMSDLQLISRNWFFVFGIFCSGVTLTLLPLVSSWTGLACVCACFGLFSGTYVGVTAVILADRLGPQRLGSSFSISLFLNGILQLGGPPICGLVFQELQTNEPILISLGVFLILGSSLWVVVPFLPPERN